MLAEAAVRRRVGVSDEWFIVRAGVMIGHGPVPGSGPILEVVAMPSGNVYALRADAQGQHADLWVTDRREPWVKVS